MNKLKEDIRRKVSDMMHSDPNIIAVAVIKGTQIIYTTDNWDISGDVDRLLSSWFGQNAQFIKIFKWKTKLDKLNWRNSNGIFI